MARPPAPFRDMSALARGYLGTVVVAAAGAAAAAHVTGSRSHEPWAAFAVLAASSALAQLFVVRSDRNQAYHTTLAFVVPGAVLLPPELVVALVLAQHAPEFVRERYRWYILLFNVSNYTLDCLAAWAAHHAVVSAGGDPAAAAVGAALVLVFTNHLLLATMLRLGRGHSFRAGGLFAMPSLATDLAPALVGVMLLVRVTTANPWLIPAAILPLYFLARSMTVPALRRAEELLEARAERQSKLVELAQLAISDGTTEAVVNRALESAAAALGIDRGHLIELPAGRRRRPRVRAAVGHDAGRVRAADALDETELRALSAGELVVTEPGEARATLSVAVPGEPKAAGVLTLSRPDSSGFEPDEIEFARGLATTISVNLDRERTRVALAISERRREQLLGEILRAEQEERVRIATELHDDTIQVMTAALFSMDGIGQALDREDDTRAHRSLRRTRDALGQAVERTRRLTFELRPPLLEASGLEAALSELGEQIGREAGFEVDVRANVRRHPFAVEDLVYRVVQEAVANVRKHARARRVTIDLHDGDAAIEGVVGDDGVGFDVTAALDRSRMRLHLGLDAMIERVRLAGGDVEVSSRPGHGSRVAFRVPLPAADGSRRPTRRRVATR